MTTISIHALASVSGILDVKEVASEEVKKSFECFCLMAGVDSLIKTFDEDAEEICGPRYGRRTGKHGHRWGPPGETGPALRGEISKILSATPGLGNHGSAWTTPPGGLLDVRSRQPDRRQTETYRQRAASGFGSAGRWSSFPTLRPPRQSNDGGYRRSQRCRWARWGNWWGKNHHLGSYLSNINAIHGKNGGDGGIRTLDTP